jgi:hypothetical protein
MPFPAAPTGKVTSIGLPRGFLEGAATSDRLGAIHIVLCSRMQYDVTLIC